MPVFSRLWVLTFKFIPICADIALAYIAYWLGKKYSSERIGLITAALMLICPAMAIDTVYWGQLDSVLTLLIVLSIIFLVRVAEKNQTKDWIIASGILTLAICTKPQAIFFVPLFVAVMIKKLNIKNLGLTILATLFFPFSFLIFAKKWDRINFLLSIATILIVATLVTLPFQGPIIGNITWLVDQITSTAGTYKQFTLNAYNIFLLLTSNLSLIKSNDMPLDSSGNIVSSWKFYMALIPVLVTFGTVWLYHIFTKQPKPKKNQKEQAPAPLPAQTILFLLGGILMLAIFVFMPQMHERYSYPALIMFYLAYASMPKNTSKISEGNQPKFFTFHSSPFTLLAPLIPVISVSFFANCMSAFSPFVLGGGDIWNKLYSQAANTGPFFSIVYILSLAYAIYIIPKLLKTGRITNGKQA